MRTARTVALLTAGEVIGKIGTFIVVVGAARVLPLRDFGVFSVALGLGALLSVVSSWGLDNVLVQRAARDPEALPGLLGTLLRMRVGVTLGLAAVLGGVDLAVGLPAGMALAVGAVVVAWLVDTATDAYRSAAVALESTAVIAAAQLVQRALTAGLTTAALAIWGSLPALSVAYLVGTLTGFAGMAAGVAWLGVRPRRREAGPRPIRRLVGSSWAAGVHSVASMALFRLDALLLAGLAGAAAAGQYAASYRLLETVVFVSWTVARGVFPRMAAEPNPDRLRRAGEAVLAVLATVFLPYAVLLWCRGADVLRLLYGDDFARSGGATLAWLAPAPLLFGAGFLAGMVVLSTGPSPVLLLGSIGALVISVALDLVLIPVWGPTGAALATSASYGMQAVLLYPAVVRRAGHPAVLRPMLPAAGGALVAAAALLLPLPLVQVGPLAAAGYAGGWLLLGHRIDPGQASVLRRLVRSDAGWSPAAARNAR